MDKRKSETKTLKQMEGTETIYFTYIRFSRSRKVALDYKYPSVIK